MGRNRNTIEQLGEIVKHGAYHIFLELVICTHDFGELNHT